MQVNILGIGGSDHDYSYCLVRDGRLICAIEEERLSREKHAIGFKSLFARGIQYCLESDPEEPDLIVSNDLVNPYIYRRFDDKILLLNHHLTHAASTFYPSGFNESAVYVADAGGSTLENGETETISLGFADASGIRFFKKHSGIKEQRFIFLEKEVNKQDNTTTRIHNSLGDFYELFTKFCGFGDLQAGKLMGLAPYGKDTYLKELWKYVHIPKDGEFIFNVNDLQLDSYIADLLGNKNFDESFQIRADIAFAAQSILEAVTFSLLNYLYEQTKCPRLAMAGGVALNSVLNSQILRQTPFKEIFVQPAAGDSGTAIGAAFYGHVLHTGHWDTKDKSRLRQNRSAFLGRKYDESTILETLKTFDEHITYQYTSTVEKCKAAAEDIQNGKIIGWFEGGSEIGPRALGHRSILADARNPDMKDTLNEKVKFRESFRPFAPMVLQEHLHEFFDADIEESPYMLMVYDVLNEKRKLIPSITHIDGSARIQTISQEDNPNIYKCIQFFYKSTSIPIILNTSFNVKGEPIVESPKDAIKCFLSTNIDVLYLENYIINKKEK